VEEFERGPFRNIWAEFDAKKLSGWPNAANP